MRKSKKNKYSFKIDSERLVDFSKINVTSRLKWLEETNRFMDIIKDKDIRDKIRSFKETRV